jgi:hypothetical protein
LGIDEDSTVKPILRCSLASALALLLAACGGGGDDAGSGPSVAVGLYAGNSSANRAVRALVLDTGRSYVIYGRSSANATPVAGVVVGDVTVNGTAVASANARDFDVESRAVSAATLAGTVATRVSLNGTLAGAVASISTFSLAYDTAYDAAPSLADLAGAYLGEMAELAGSQPAVLNIDASGVVAGTTTAGCEVIGLAGTHATGNVYDLTLTFRSGCTDAGQTLKGHAFRNGSQLYAVVVNSALSRAVVWAGVKS